jgi:hypothetical protein
LGNFACWAAAEEGIISRGPHHQVIWAGVIAVLTITAVPFLMGAVINMIDKNQRHEDCLTNFGQGAISHVNDCERIGRR